MPDPTSNCGADTRASEILALLKDNVDLPVIDLTNSDYSVPDFSSSILSQEAKDITNEDLTTGKVDGSGTFDILLSKIESVLESQFSQGRLSADQYANALIQLSASAMSSSVQFLLGRDAAKWGAVLVQEQAKAAAIQATVSAVALETAKAQYAISVMDKYVKSAEYSLLQMKLASEDAQFCNTIAQTNLVNAQINASVAQTAQVNYQTTQIMPHQKNLVLEQAEAARAQTLDKRTDGATITGSIGKQKELYSQQIESYEKDSQYKVAKMYLDAYITQLGVLEGETPTALQNTQINTVMTKIRASHGLN